MMMLGLAPLDTSDKVYSITPSSMSTGAVTSLPGFLLGGDNLGVTNSTAYGVTGKTFGLAAGYVGAGEFTQPLFETLARGRDVVVRTWARIGQLYLRCDRATGRGIKITWSGQTSNGSLSVGYCTNIPDTFPEFWPGYNIGGVSLFSTEDLASYVTGWDDADTTGDEFVFSLIANVLTIEWNGYTIYETDELWFAMNTGTVLFNGIIAEGGIRDTEITFQANSTTYTDHDNRILDFRDWGWKSLQTTGSMSAGSTTLTVASAAGFAIGDPILVECGGEAGAGAAGTVGVGGTWPATRVANFAALPDATTYRASNNVGDCLIWVEDEQSVYINYLVADVPTWGEWTDYILASETLTRTYWHTTRLLPRALQATITNISGNTLTLDTASEVATTDATVWYNCGWGVVDYLMPNSKFSRANPNAVSNDPWEIRLGTGTFCCPGEMLFPWGVGWSIRGTDRTTTELYAPKGSAIPKAALYGDYPEMSDFKVRGWAGEEGFCFAETNGFPILAGYAFGPGGTFRPGGLFERLDFVNTWGGVLIETRLGGIVRDVTGTHTNGNTQNYVSWFFQNASGDADCLFEDITYTADKVGTAFEFFGCNGGTMRRCTAINGVVASNASGGYLFDELTVTIDWNERTTINDWIPTTLPAININTNTPNGVAILGGTIRNPTITVVKDELGRIPTGININGEAINVTVEGTHTAKPGTGVITMSDYEIGDAGYGAVGVQLDTAGCTIRGIRVIGAASDGSPYYNISAYFGGDDCVVEDCVAETIVVGGVDQVGSNGNITNAEYDAL